MSVDERVFPSSFRLSTKAAPNLNEEVPSVNPPLEVGRKVALVNFNSPEPAITKSI